MFLLDTNVISELRPGKRDQSPAVRAWASRVPLERQHVSVVTLYEIEVGVLAMERRDPAQGAGLRAWLTSLRPLFGQRILPVTDRIASRCAALQVPNRMPVMDALIAATSLEHSLTLITRNVGDFADRGVPMLNPWAFKGEE